MSIFLGMGDMRGLFGLDGCRTATEIRAFSKQNRISKARHELRGDVKIAIIDDEKFKALNNLKAYGYDVSELQDINRINEIENYDIILCDLMGVGLNFDKKRGGASLIKEIKASYPTKIVIAYTGARANSVEAQSAKEHCDLFLKKDADLAEWSDSLDGFIDHIIDPYKMWISARQILFEAEVDIKLVLRLEDAYVSAVLGKDSEFSKLKRLISTVELSGHAKSIVQSLIASAIYNLIFSSC